MHGEWVATVAYVVVEALKVVDIPWWNCWWLLQLAFSYSSSYVVIKECECHGAVILSFGLWSLNEFLDDAKYVEALLSFR